MMTANEKNGNKQAMLHGLWAALFVAAFGVIGWGSLSIVELKEGAARQDQEIKSNFASAVSETRLYREMLDKRLTQLERKLESIDTKIDSIKP